MTASNLINNRYQLQQELGAGGMGTVYRAYDRLSQTGVAIKRLNMPAEFFAYLDAGSSSDMMLSLAHEFEMLAGLRHPNIISVLDYGFDEGKNPYLVEEYLANAHPLTHYARAKPEGEVVRLIMQLLQALAYLHRRGILHRDIKPENVLVVEGRVKVLDFGLSSARGQTGEAVGTLGYMAPEILQHQIYSEASDLYATGVLAYQALAGRLPFADNSMEVMVQQIMQQPADIAHLDVRPAVAACLGSLLAKDAAERPQTAIKAMHDLAAAIGDSLHESPAIRESFLQAATFVGRQTELAQLKAALEDAQLHRGSLWLVGGESGVGKTRLLDELRTRALVKGVQVMRGQGVAEGGLPYQLWREVARRLVLHSDLSDLEAGILQELVPDIETLLGREIPPAPELSGAAAQRRLATTLAGLFRRQPQPVLLLLEDLQWADESLKPLHSLAPLVDTLPLLVVGTFRSEERPGLPAELPAMRHLPLERLNRQEIASLSTAMLGAAGQQDAVIRLLESETEGNAFFAVEVVRALAEESGSLAEVGKVTLPQGLVVGGIQRIIQRRLDKVPAGDLPLLRLAAVGGRGLDLAVLRALAQNLDLESWLSRLSNVAVLAVSEGEWRFAHDKLREALLAGIPAADRPRLHARLARAIEAVHPADGAYAPTLAKLWQAAGDAQQEAGYALLAGALALKLGRIAEARDYYQRVLELLPLVELEQSEAEVWQHLADTERRLSNYETSLGHYERALALARAGGDDIVQANSYRGLAGIAFEQGSYSAARDHIMQGLDAAERSANPHTRASLMQYRGNIEHRSGNVDEAYRLYHEAAAILETLPTKDSSLIAIYNNLGIIDSDRGRYPAAIAAYQRCVQALREAGDMLAVGQVLNNLGTATRRAGDLAAAEQYYAEALAIIQPIGNRFVEAIITGNLGEMAAARHDFSRSRHFHENALAIAQAINSRHLTIINTRCLGLALMFLGEETTARTNLAEALAIAREVGDRAAIAEILCDRAALALRHEGAAAVPEMLAEALAIAQELNSPPHQLKTATVAAGWHLQQGRLLDAARLAGLVQAQQQAMEASVVELYLGPLLDELAAVLPINDMRAALGEGAGLDRDTALAALILPKHE
jgi:tetratricopeptide (TPR) repeat protein